MCTYNGDKYIQAQLDSLARQSRLPYELIICDDCSTDETLSIAESFSRSAKFIVKIYKNDYNAGSTKNFEKAISLCQGDIIALSDQDDVWHADKLKLIDDSFSQSIHVGALFSNGNVVSENLLPLGYTLWDIFKFSKKDRFLFANGKSTDLLLNHNFITGATLAFRSHFRDIILPIPHLWVHDAWIALILSVTSRIGFIDKELIEYRQHEAQQIGGSKKKISAQTNTSTLQIELEQQLVQFGELIDHICRIIPDSNNVSVMIVKRIIHINNRIIILRSKFFERIIKSIQELCTARYHKYSDGYKSFLKDIIRFKR